MAYTLKKYYDDVVDLAASYGVEIRLGKRHFYRAIQMSVDEVFRRIFPKRPQIFEKTATLADGDPLPSDYVAFQDVYMLDGSGNRIGFRFAPIPEIPAMKLNTTALATSTEPVFNLYRNATNDPLRFHTLPVAIASVQFVYTSKPTVLWDYQNTTGRETITSNLPEDTDQLVVRGAFERLTVMMVEEQDALNITQAGLERIQAANAELYMEHLTNVLSRTS